MPALRLLDWHSEPQLEEVPVPEPGSDEVLVRVGGAGACHSDLHLMHEFEAGALAWGPPFMLGHENAGWVRTVGSGVRGLEPGQPVCGTCRRCLDGLETYCERPDLAPVPGGGGGLTPDHAVRRSWSKLGPTATALVFGIGGLGHLCVQALRATTAARVVAVDPRGSARDLALECGADLALAPGDDLVAEVRESTRGLGVDVVLDMVTDETLPVSFFGVPFEASVQ